MMELCYIPQLTHYIAYLDWKSYGEPRSEMESYPQQKLENDIVVFSSPQ